MADENKIFKSKTIELFGKHFEVNHKASKSINNKFLIILGLCKYYINKITLPISNFISNRIVSDFFEPFLLIIGIGVFLILFFSFIFTMADIADKPNTCRNNCDIFDEYCNNSQENISDCIKNNTYFYREFIKNLIVIFNFCSSAILYLFFSCIFIGVIINLIVWITTKIYDNLIKINESIPDISEV